jgi:hypothetical protein
VKCGVGFDWLDARNSLFSAAVLEANTHAPERIKLRLVSRMKPHPTDAYRHSVEKNFSPVE